MVQKTTSKTVFGPTVEEAAGMAAPTEMAPAQNAAPSFYDSPYKLPVGGFKVGDTTMYGAKRLPIGDGATLSVGANPMRSGVGVDLRVPFKKGGKACNAQAKKGSKPTIMKKAAGGAAKVRKGMATPEGKIIAAMHKIRGK